MQVEISRQHRRAILHARSHALGELGLSPLLAWGAAHHRYYGRDPAVRRLVVLLALNGCGVRNTSRVLGVSPTAMLKLLWVEAALIGRASPTGLSSWNSMNSGLS